MAGPNLEIFKFGMYIMFPIGWMYYFGTNLENRFSVPDFWPKPEATYRIPFERDEIKHELEVQRAQRLLRREQRLQKEHALARGRGEAIEGSGGGNDEDTRSALSSLWRAWEVLEREGHDGRQMKRIRGTKESEA